MIKTNKNMLDFRNTKKLLIFVMFKQEVIMDLDYLLNIERSILSSIIFEPSNADMVFGILSIEDFYLSQHQYIYNAIITLANDDLPIDETFILKILKTNKEKFDENYLVNVLVANAITNVEAYCFEVKENSKLRKLGTMSKNINKYLADELKSDDVLHAIQKEIEHIEKSSQTIIKSSHEIIQEVLDDMQLAIENGGKTNGQKSGLKSLDKIIGAFEDGDLIVIAARPSMGKTSIISTITIESLKAGNGVLIESLEMPAKKIVARLLSAKSGEYLNDIKHGLVRNKNNFNDALKFFQTKNLIISDKAYPTITELQSRIKLVLRKNPNIKTIFIDHTGKIQLLNNLRNDIEIGLITAMLKKIARDFNIRVFLLQQLNRGLEARENKRPMLSDLKNSGNIEEDADIVLGLYRESYYKQKNAENSVSHAIQNNTIEAAEIIVLKNRDGETATAKVSFEGRCSRFLDKLEIPTIIEFEG
jgi:replicative DNA helicase